MSEQDPHSAQTPPLPEAEGADAVRPFWQARDVPGPRRRTGLGMRLIALGLLTALAMVVVTLRNQAISLPTWAVTGIEGRANDALEGAAPGLSLALGGASLALDEGFVPRVALADLRFLAPDGKLVAALPEVNLALDGPGLLAGRFVPHRLSISGAEGRLTRRVDGGFNLQFVGQAPAAPISSLAELFGLVDRLLATPSLTQLQEVAIDGLSVDYADQGSGLKGQIGDGRLQVLRSGQDLALDLSASLTLDRQGTALAQIRGRYDGQMRAARLSATLESGLDTALVAAQVPALAWLQVVQAPLVATMEGQFSPAGMTRLDARLNLGAGAFRPNPRATPVPFDKAHLALSYAGADGRVTLSSMAVEGKAASIAAHGHILMQDASGAPSRAFFAGALPKAFVAQLQIDEASLLLKDQFAAPIRVSGGSADLRLRLDPFQLDIGQARLTLQDEVLAASGRIATGEGGWRVALDLGLDRMSAGRVVELWPLRLIPRTRGWLGANLQGGEISNLRGALRARQGSDPVTSLSFDFHDLALRYIPSLPPIEKGRGHAALTGRSFTVFLASGGVMAPQGGWLDAAGTSFEVPDVTAPPPALARVRLGLGGALTAALSLLDQPPFRFLGKADLPVDLGEGRIEARGQIDFPLKAAVPLAEMRLDVAGRISGFRSDRLVKSRVLSAEALEVEVSNAGLTITGPGRLDGLGFDAQFRQGFAAADKGRAGVRGRVLLDAAQLAGFGIDLPPGMAQGKAWGDFTLDLVRGAPGVLAVQSRLEGMALRLPELGWAKPAAQAALLDLEVRLASPAEVTAIRLDAEALRLRGRMRLAPGGGGLARAEFDEVKVADWLTGRAELVGQGKGQAVETRLTEAVVDLRRIPPRERMGAAPGRRPGALVLSGISLVVTDTIRFQGLSGRFSTRGGLDGDFVARLGGRVPVTGTVVPAQNGSAVRLRAEDAGALLAEAGIFSTGIGGQIEVAFVPMSAPGSFAGQALVRDFRVRHTSGLSELLNAISVVGLLQSLNGSGIAFDQAEVDFTLRPSAVVIHRGAAVGASMGISLEGVYQIGQGQVDLRGTISPLFFLNSIGSIFSRPGEGLFGFNYRMSGSPRALDVAVNPLSILTPGMFREIFRAPPPQIKEP